MYIELPALGADVSHAAPGADRPSIAGMVSSVDENFSQYVASTRVQEPRTELIAELDGMIEVKSCRDSCLVFWAHPVLQYAIENFYTFWRVMRNREVLPHRIIFYRLELAFI